MGVKMKREKIAVIPPDNGDGHYVYCAECTDVDILFCKVDFKPPYCGNCGKEVK